MPSPSTAMSTSNRFAEQQVADRAADEVHAAHAGGDGLDLAQQPVQAELPKRTGEIGHDRRWRLRRAHVPGHRAPRDRPEHVVDGDLRGGGVAHHGRPPDLLLGDARGGVLERACPRRSPSRARS